MISYETLKKETIGLSDDKMATLIAFARFLKSSMPGTNKTMISSAEEPSDVESNTGTPKRVIGFLTEDFVSIAPDFDTCLEGLENYI